MLNITSACHMSEREHMSNGYVTLKIPHSLADPMDKLVGKFGFKSRAEIAKEAIRKLLLEYPES